MTPFEISATSSASFVLRSRRREVKGRFTRLKGQLDIDLEQLSNSRGQVSLDLSSVEIISPTDEASTFDDSHRARHWLGLNAVTERENPELRYATFSILAVENASHAAPHLGKLESARSLTMYPEAGASTRAQVDEVRRVTIDVRGDLTLHNRRAQRSAALALHFGYPASDVEAVRPEMVVASTRRPFLVPLADFDIRPRDSNGRLLAKQAKLANEQLGKVARVTLDLHLTPSSK